MAKKRIEDIAIDRSKSFKRQLKKDLRTSKEQASRNIDVSISLFDYVENTPGMSRILLAQKLGVSQAYLCKLINGKVNLTINTIEKYEKILAIDLIPRTTPKVVQKEMYLLRIPQENIYSRGYFSLQFNSLYGFPTNNISNGNSIQICRY